jgi:hypothetical protein
MIFFDIATVFLLACIVFEELGDFVREHWLAIFIGVPVFAVVAVFVVVL